MIFTCLLIFLGRIVDVSLGSIRIILLGKGKSFVAFCTSFIEILVWFIISKDALSSKFNIWVLLSYSFGFAAGTFIGSKLAERFIKGTFGIQIITSNKNNEVILKLRNEGYAVSVIDVKGMDENRDKYMLFIEINKNKFNEIRELVRNIDRKAFIVVNDTRYVQNGYFK